MEDEHIAIALKSPQSMNNAMVSMFAVWDGHGGKEVARWVKKYMHEELVKLEEYNQAEFDQALVNVFHRMDEMYVILLYYLQRSTLKTQDRLRQLRPPDDSPLYI
jgi:serine/threonine protein phosphatase PrpC